MQSYQTVVTTSQQCSWEERKGSENISVCHCSHVKINQRFNKHYHFIQQSMLNDINRLKIFYQRYEKRDIGVRRLAAIPIYLSKCIGAR